MEGLIMSQNNSGTLKHGAPGFAKQLLRLALSLFGLVIDEADALYNRAVRIFIGLIAVIPVELAYNVMGYPQVNIIISLCLATGTLIAFGKPKNIAAVAAVSVAKKTVLNKEQKVLDKNEPPKTVFGLYWDALKWILLAETAISFYLAHVPFKENPMAIFAIIAGCIPIAMMGKIWEKELGGTLGIELGYSGLIAMVIMDFLSLFPAEFWTNSSPVLGGIVAKAHQPGMSLFLLLQTTLYIFLMIRMARAEKKGKYMFGFAVLGLISWYLFSPHGEKGSGAPVADSSQSVAAGKMSTVPLTIPIGKSIPAIRPAGYYLAAVDCPASVVYDIVDSSTGNVMGQQDCAMQHDPKKSSPLNINLVIYQKGDDGSPVDVIVYWKKI